MAAEAVDSRHFGCIAEAEEADTIVLVIVEAMRWEAPSQRAGEQGRSLLVSSSWSGGKRCAGQPEPKQQTDLGGLWGFVRLAIRESGPRVHTRDLLARVSLSLV